MGEKEIRGRTISPFFSVIIPVFNREKIVLRAVQSVLNQTFQDFELIVIDDGSADQTADLIKNLKDSRLSYYYQVNQGVSSARNLGIAKSKGEWIAFLDSDDAWHPEKLEIQLAEIEKSHYLWHHTEELWFRNGEKLNPKKKHRKTGGRIYLNSLPLCVVSPSTVCIHKNIFKEIGVFDPLLTVAEDYDLWLRISARYEIGFYEKPLIDKYGGHADQLSKTFHGMDRFRVRALKKQLDSPFLTLEEKKATKNMILEKARILKEGYDKHGKTVIADYYQKLAENLKDY